MSATLAVVLTLLISIKEDMNSLKKDLNLFIEKSMPKIKKEKKAKKVSADILVSDITTFFTDCHSTRANNDATNKTRENIIKIIDILPSEFLDDPTYGTQWRNLQTEWNLVIKKVAEKTGIPSYKKTEINMKGGRSAHYDADIIYITDDKRISRKIEFKSGTGTTINSLPQFLSLPVKFNIFPITYDTFYYENYLDKYIACDGGLTEAKPSLEKYCKDVVKVNYSVSPFFTQLKEREEAFFKAEKNLVVNSSITEYLTLYGEKINIAAFSEKVKETQTDKIYLLWNNGTFTIDELSPAEMTNMTYHGIKNGNLLEVKAEKTSYYLLLRWRNHKGILNPAWQISIKRTA